MNVPGRIKRIFDCLLSLVALIILLPLLLLLYGLIYVRLGSPVLFPDTTWTLWQTVYALQVSHHDSAHDTSGNLLPDADRLSPFGQFLRSTSLDELPELVNVLKGDMSLVGPRPLLMQYLNLYTVHQARRHEVRPGITGWAQINGRNALSWEDRFDLDVWYVDHHSLWLDVRIIAMTVWKVLRREDISQDGQATMQLFQGSSGWRTHDDNVSEGTKT